jgi:hypothetical protein
VVAGSEAAAALWKVLIHLGTDAVLVVAAVLGLVGAALCRQPRISALFLLWIAVNVVVASAGGFGGARLRMPFEPFLMILASVVLAGDWRRPHPALLTLAIASGVAAALIILPQIPRSLSAWPDFGIRWDSVIVRRRGQIHGTAGINVPAFEGTSRISGKSLSQPAPIRLDVRAGRALIRTTALDAHEQRISWPAGPDFVELRAVDMRGSAPADVEITIERR